MTITIQQITTANEADLRLPNEPFPIIGEFLVTRTEAGWSHQERLAAQVHEQTFPEENYQLAAIDAAGFALGAYAEEQCVGLATFEYQFNRFVYLADLKVTQTYRRSGVARALLDAAKPIAQAHGSQGLCTIAQGSNVIANRFYLAYGFHIGGLETFRYEFTRAKGETDIHYWLAY
ncbi:GNAT family N-acetyltransferase [Lacticaseibacillus nasuensis]|uniref:GNAT family N-acetyltransferase n=1 Tax=Lacticaseibacillus nasuensis TaxID=944671 RepID=UPI002244FCC6|nr:GNAT family N-acetyltransferase [Lacticaseibacillus nasuensis]MCX2454766.1 GNAT family N-acetyltransferase [Lacticaseibacillus nasuensis]